MKKLITIVMILSMILLIACNTEKRLENSGNTSDSICNNSENISHIDSGNIEMPTDDTLSSTEKVLGYRNFPKTYDLWASYDDDKTVEANDFFEWCKTVVTDDTLNQEYPDNSIFINYLNSVNSLLVPTIRNNDYYLRRINVTPDDATFAEYSFWYTNDKHTITIDFIPMKNNGFKALTLSDYMESLTYDCTKATKESPWGEYYTTASSTGVGAYFATCDYIIHIFIETNPTVKTTEFQPEYFDYFDFETVSLKD